jgi:hypothetical protein
MKENGTEVPFSTPSYQDSKSHRDKENGQIYHRLPPSESFTVFTAPASNAIPAVAIESGIMIRKNTNAHTITNSILVLFFHWIIEINYPTIFECIF